MTNDELRRVSARIADARMARRADMDPAAPATTPSGERVGGPFTVGDRVMDMQSGREGEVSNVLSADRDGIAWIYVRFDDGGASITRPGQLLARPRPPAGRS